MHYCKGTVQTNTHFYTTHTPQICPCAAHMQIECRENGSKPQRYRLNKWWRLKLRMENYRPPAI